MELLECIHEQLSGNRLPLVGIAVAAVSCPDTPIILTLHWHGFVQDLKAGHDENEAAALAPVPSTSLQLNARWNELAELESATLEAGWELGAWDVVRAQRPPCLRPGAPAREAFECLQAFGQCPLPYQGNELVVSDAPDVDELIKLAAHSGYVSWQFRPVFNSLWVDVHDDVTLDVEGKRDPQCPLVPRPTQGEGSQRTVYTFGEHARHNE
jgi:hypothetical protein